MKCNGPPRMFAASPGGWALRTTPVVASNYHLIARFLLTVYMWIRTIPIDRR
jgi:hypothetical protein